MHDPLVSANQHQYFTESQVLSILQVINFRTRSKTQLCILFIVIMIIIIIIIHSFIHDHDYDHHHHLRHHQESKNQFNSFQFNFIHISQASNSTLWTDTFSPISRFTARHW